MAALNLSFVSAVKEIEASYGGLPKASRLRVEKWVERLVTSAGNEAWARHRNAYAKLLLGQVLAKKLEEPFLSNPAAGSLPPFPRHLMHHLKGILGVHEGAFWRDLYARMDLDETNFEPLVAKPHKPVAQPVSIPNDLQGLKMLIKEQMSRIALLEQQLHHERQAHEAEVQELLTQVEAAARPPAPPLSPSITSKRIIPNRARQALKIYDIARPAVVEHHLFDSADAEFVVPSVARASNDSWRKPHDEEAENVSPHARATGLSKTEADFLKYLDEFQTTMCV